ncbi:M17 family metallopeptidase [Mycoplasmopsis gallinacea]|uniref:Probable cytosol aminopeptidase n=1 Tax=Mycoplasmopsis gallinacea TaxID=29556 RepID=A0A449A2X0_9BACT|nr:M17 family metallopeptidase [Mycoplasmopsis gallinacea]VEU58595.1 Cytosol aminopeptidase [Mycoplasmopsis gallinacea]
MLKITKEFNKENIKMLLAFEGENLPAFVGKKHGKITIDFANNLAYLFAEKDKQSLFELHQLIKDTFGETNYDFDLDFASFVKHFKQEEILRALISKIYFAKANLFKKSIELDNKKDEEQKEKSLNLVLGDSYEALIEQANKYVIIAEQVNKTRNLQIMPENFLNSEMLAAKIAEDFSGIENLKVTTLTKKEIQDLGMNLLLSVNQGSTHEPRVVIVEYKGNPENTESVSIVGKGITFDTGGVNTKGYHMEGMKYDMSGSVIAAYAVKSLALLKAKVNASAIMCITDNRINNDASLPENVYKSMSGKWVEVVDTDAEGRLVLADGLYYAASILKPSTIVDVATLTASILVSLGNTYSGIFTENDTKYSKFEAASKLAQEKVWRMPIHEDFNKGNKGSKVADLASWSSSVKQDSSQAAMFLKEFTNGIDFIHCDVAGTADKAGEPQGELVATLVEFCLNQ